MFQDIRYSARMLLKQPGFTLIAVITLALGIGANTAIFSVVNGVLLRPLAYHEPDQIMTLLNEGQFPVSPANFLDFRANAQSFEQMSAPLDLRPRATSRGGNSLRVFARLKPGVSQTQAQAEIDTMNNQLVQAYPDDNAGLNIRVTPLNEKVVGNVRPALLALSVTVGFVLLIACANVACLLLARAASRQKEAAVRVALGASRWRILRQLLTESLMLSLCGAAVGILLAVWGVNWLTVLLAGNSTSFSVKLPRLSEIKLDAVALVFTFTVSLVASVLFGLALPLFASKPDLNQVLKESGRGTTGRRRGLREMLVVVELALALMLLVGAGLLMNSFVKLQAVDPGFNPRNVLTMTTSLAGASQYVGPTREALYQQLTDPLTALPGGQSVSAINHLPLAGA